MASLSSPSLNMILKACCRRDERRERERGGGGGREAERERKKESEREREKERESKRERKREKEIRSVEAKRAKESKGARKQ